jgi:ribonuclease
MRYAQRTAPLDQSAPRAAPSPPPIGLVGQELLPGRARSARRWTQPLSLQDRPHRRGTHPMPVAVPPGDTAPRVDGARRGSRRPSPRPNGSAAPVHRPGDERSGTPDATPSTDHASPTGPAKPQLNARAPRFRHPHAGSGAENAAGGAKLAEDPAAAEQANPLIDSLRAAGKLLSNYLTKAQAAAAGWQAGKALGNYVPGGQLGGDVFVDPASIGLPVASGRTWFEADIGLSSAMSRAKQAGTRLLYLSDGLAYVTPNHCKWIYQLPGW